mgnify:CR=1 FL=1
MAWLNQQERLQKLIRAKKRRGLWFQSGQLSLPESVDKSMNKRVQSGKFGLLRKEVDDDGE